MKAAMDSPDHKPILSSNENQGSPFFHFLCSLSPIKLVRSGHGTQTFTELSFPPPPAIFVSPKAESQKESARSKRKLLAGESESEVGKDVQGGSSQFLSNVEKESLTWRQPTRGQQQELVTGRNQPFPACGHAPSSKALQESEGHMMEQETRTSVQASERPSVSSTGVQCSRWETTCSASEATFVKEEPHKESAGPCALPAGVESSLSETHAACFGFQGRSHMEMLNQSDMDKNRDVSCLPSHNSKHMSTCWPVPMEGLSRILASLQGVLKRDNQAGSFNPNFQQAKVKPLDDQELQMQNIDDGCKTTITGVRRRCLDFKTPEMQQDNVPTHRPSSDNHSHHTFVMPSEPEPEPEPEPASKVSFGDRPLMVWGHGMHTTSSSDILAQYASEPGQSLAPNAAYFPSKHRAYHVSDPRLPFQTGQTFTRLHSHSLGSSMSEMEFSGPDNTGDGGAQPFIARSLPFDSFQGSSAPSENHLLQGRGYPQAEHLNSLDQDLLVALIKKTAMNQHDLLLANTSSDLPMNYYQPLTHSLDSVEQNNYGGVMENELSSLAQEAIVHQETSHHSESDHQEDSTHSPRSPKKKRKLSAQVGDVTGDGCKNCKCKKSKCLKLYCECFAAGVYCIDICSCRDCYNKPEFEEMVLGTRQQIESRNPLAFLPKIIRTSDTSPAQGEETNDTPASARHKRGCNCKKSQCLKKYCECYQAGVGCAEGCRCEGCKNIYGRNEGNGELDDKEQQIAALEMKMAANDGSIETEFKQTPEHQNDQLCTDLSPITPYLENSGQCRSNLEVRPTENLGPLFEHRASIISESPSRLLELLEETEHFGQVNLQPCHAASKSSITDLQHLSSGWEGQDELYTPTPAMRPLQPRPALSHVLLSKSNASHSLWTNHDNYSTNINSCIPGLANPQTNQSSLIQQVTPLVKYSPSISHFQTPDDALTVPLTPMVSTMHASRPHYDLEELSESQTNNVWFSDNDDSPTVLREINAFSAPNIIRKTRSPQQKRVFSYQQQNLKSTGTFSPGLGSRNGRKYILHALPSSADRPGDGV